MPRNEEQVGPVEGRCLHFEEDLAIGKRWVVALVFRTVEGANAISAHNLQMLHGQYLFSGFRNTLWHDEYYTARCGHERRGLI